MEDVKNEGSFFSTEEIEEIEDPMTVEDLIILPAAVAVMGDTQLAEFVNSEGFEPNDSAATLSQEEGAELKVDSNLSSIAIAVKTQRRRASKRFLEKIQENLKKPLSPAQPSDEQQSEVVSEIIDEPVETFPEDRCANCLEVFSSTNEKVSFVTTSEDESEETVPIIDAIHTVFQINQGKPSLQEETVLYLCGNCCETLNMLYSLLKKFSSLAKDESYLKLKLKEIEKNTQKKRRGRKPKNLDPLQTNVKAEEAGKDTVDWAYLDTLEEENEKVHEGTDDEDFYASPSDGNESSSTASSSGDESYIIPVKKRALETKKKLKKERKSGDSSEDEIPSDTVDSTRKIKKRKKKTLLYDLTYTCNVCSMDFLQPKYLRSHLRENHATTVINATEEERLLLLKQDGFVADNENLAKNDEESAACRRCEKCRRTFLNEKDFTDHQQIHNIVENPYKCKSCNTSFRTAGELKCHFRNEHVYNAESGNDERKKISSVTPCPVCAKTFVRPDQLKQHLRVHTKEKPFACKLCSKTFSEIRGLQYHEITHSDDRPYVCVICGARFKRLHHLKDHEKNHQENTERPFSCHTCQKAFKFRKHLNCHMLIHENSKEHKCDTCGRQFNRKDNLRQHIRKVHGKEIDTPASSTEKNEEQNLISDEAFSTTTTITQAIPLETVNLGHITLFI